MPRDELDALVDARIEYTVDYAFQNSPFYRKRFKENNITVSDIKSHEDLRELPIITGQTIREKQPPETEEFEFKCEGSEIFTIHETSGTSDTPKAFFLTWDDWNRYAEKYARSFTSQGVW